MIIDVKYTKRAICDLDSIYEYISEEFSAPKTAESIVNLIRAAIRKLNEMPRRFKLCDDEPWRSKGIRCFNVKNYMVFYLPNESDKTVTILSVMYGGRNIQEQLKEIEI